MSVQIIRGNALDLPLADDSVDLCITSPPYFGLRSYQDGGAHYESQIGSEATPAGFVDALIAATREMVRVVKPSGSIWVNLGDKYAGGGGQWDKDERPDPHKLRAASGSIGTGGKTYGLRPKSLIGVPWRYALRCIDDLGLILRAEVIWSKPNGLPESVTDRVRRSHETWFHFTLNPRYYSAVDEIREESKPGQSPAALSFNRNGRETAPGQTVAPHRIGREDQGLNPLGKLPGSVWTIPTQPLTVPPHLGVDHFAAFPMEWPRRIVTGWSPREVCTVCGEGRRPVAAQTDSAYAAERARVRANKTKRTEREEGLGDVFGGVGGRTNTEGFGLISNGVVKPSYAITGYACACPHPTAPATPGIVLDPFGGTGTTALVAHALSRHGITVDMSADYCRLARWRTSDPKELARAQQREYIPPREQVDGQDTFDFEGLGA
jgi:DNA modification methylase